MDFIDEDQEDDESESSEDKVIVISTVKKQPTHRKSGMLLSTDIGKITNQSKEFLKSEIERMINILRQKQEAGGGVHTFRRVEANVKSSATAITLEQHGHYEEV